MAKPRPLHGQRHVIPAYMSAQKPNNSYAPVTEYETKRLPCSGCGKPVVWTAEQQRTWYEDMKASIYATVNLRCDACRKRGQHDNHRRRSREKARRQSGRSE
jgi:hypothetical protein